MSAREYSALFGDIQFAKMRIKNAYKNDDVSPTYIRALEREVVERIEGYAGVWMTYPISAPGSPECNAEEADFMRRHHLAMIRLQVVEALQLPGDDEMTREEFAQRLRALREEFVWLDAQLPARFRNLMGTYGASLQHVEAELRNLGPTKSATSSSGGCYVATAVYGSYDCAPVWTLRRFRDDRLATTAGGRALIQAYYATSPNAIHLLGSSKALQIAARTLLDALVALLQANGYEKGPYNDPQRP